MKRKTMREIFKTTDKGFKVRCGSLGIYEMVRTFFGVEENQNDYFNY